MARGCLLPPRPALTDDQPVFLHSLVTASRISPRQPIRICPPTRIKDVLRFQAPQGLAIMLSDRSTVATTGRHERLAGTLV